MVWGSEVAGDPESGLETFVGVELGAVVEGDGFGYAIVGWPAKKAMGFYEKTVNAQVIENSSPGIYSRMIDS